MYSIRNFLRQTPNKISAGVGSILTTLGLLDLSPFTDKQNLGIVGCLAVLLALFYVDPLVSSNAKLQTLSDARSDPQPAKKKAAKK